MAFSRDEFKKQLSHSFEQFLSDKNEKSLVNVYEFGRRAVNAGLGELDLISLLEEIQHDIKSDNTERELKSNSENLLKFLSECLAPFELTNRGYQGLIAKQEINNKKLKEEIERRKQSEEELSRRKEHFQHLLENALDIITVLNYDGTIRYESPSLKRILGYEPSEVINDDVFNYIHPEDAEEIKGKLTDIMESPGKMDSVEFRCKHKDGSWRYLDSIAKNAEDPIDGPGVIVNSRDVTERVKAWNRLEKSEKQLTTAQKLGKLGSWEWDIDRNQLTWSDELCNIFGVEKGAYPKSYNEYLQKLLPDDRDRAKKHVNDALENDKEYGFEHKIKRPDGEIRVLYGRGEAVSDENGRVIKMIGTAQDITEMKDVEEKLRAYSRQLKKLTAKQEKVREEERIRIAREIHDELGQMLTVLKMDVSMAINRRKKEAGEEAVAQFSEEIYTITNRIDTIIESVQRITTELRPGVLDNLGIKEALEWQAGEFQKRSGVELEFKDSGSSFKYIKGEQATTVFRIFQETLTNILRHANASKVDITLEENDNYLILTVRDDGKGITNEEIKDSDSLGIIGMRERSQILGGNIEFKGIPGSGTTVILKIPVDGS